ncbi:MaoC domain-containing protein dehydratase [Streptomyces albus]|uniref:MaoC domain-containing protein dehydratase n=1 Tax=Streptomyces albus (strain ATCC 21838 / DSM 41398 / FERM P-419 / JCM 4703 / NBRC 107858) TaxID=1081613 RepID=A0A0B5EWX9_STRA4|nr:MaoC domain-containing protein dehydratase [Streptomyces albus]AOU81611.1 MaoC domain-containing protein dehydratase [Streptomyces albus]AYN37303.1 acyl dehydratase [Streptomyces albus]
MSDLTGTVVDRVAFEVERGKIREFARATFAEDPVHTDQSLSLGAGFPDVLATGTHVVASGHQRDQRGFVEKLGLELSRVVVGSVSWHYRRPLACGDALRATRRVVDDRTRESRGGGSLRLVTLETEFLDQAGEVAVTQREVLIERGRA